jgi:hypothetical protein
MVSLDHFLLPRGKAELSAISVMQGTFQKTWDGVMRTIAKEDIVAVFRRWKERRKSAFGSGVALMKK